MKTWASNIDSSIGIASYEQQRRYLYIEYYNEARQLGFYYVMIYFDMIQLFTFWTDSN